MAATVAPTRNIGKVVQVIGPVLDVEFEADKLPEIYNALRITAKSDAGGDIAADTEPPAVWTAKAAYSEPEPEAAEEPDGDNGACAAVAAGAAVETCAFLLSASASDETGEEAAVTPRGPPSPVSRVALLACAFAFPLRRLRRDRGPR